MSVSPAKALATFAAIATLAAVALVAAIPLARGLGRHELVEGRTSILLAAAGISLVAAVVGWTRARRASDGRCARGT